MINKKTIEAVESIIEYHFKEPRFLEESLTHPSVTRQCHDSGKTVNYERLEFLGDAVLGLIIAELLIRKYPFENEGALAKRQSGLVRGEAVANVARTLNIGIFIRMTPGEESLGGRENDNNIENCLEAIIGAMYKDGGIEPAKAFIHKHWTELVDRMVEPPKDPKTALQEWAQARNIAIPIYEVKDISGLAHAPEFTIQVSVEGHGYAQAKALSKKKAQKDAAKMLLNQLES